MDPVVMEQDISTPPVSLEPDPTDVLLAQLRVLEARGQTAPGLVRDRIGFYESYAGSHPRQSTKIVDLNAYMRAHKRLRPRSRTYGDQLRIASALNPAERSVGLQGFLKQHDQLMYTLTQRMKEADGKWRSSQDFLHVAEWLLKYLQLLFSMYRVLDDSGVGKSSSGWTCVVGRAIAIIELAEGVMRDTFTELRSLLPRPDDDTEYENVGPDHDLGTLGADIPSEDLQTLQDTAKTEAENLNTNDGDRGPLFRCCVCLSEYEDPDTPFKLDKCRHIIGRQCMEGWLNGNAKAATSCPQCRTLLCERRARVPKGQTEEQRLKIDRILARRKEIWTIMADVFALLKKARGTRETKEIMARVNRRLSDTSVVFRVGELQQMPDGQMERPIEMESTDERTAT